MNEDGLFDNTIGPKFIQERGLGNINGCMD
jgi:hypothetical protein